MVTHMTLYRILEYESTSGRSPFNEWFGGLDAQAAEKINAALTRLANGNTSNVKGVEVAFWRPAWTLGRDIEFISGGMGTISSSCWAVAPNAASRRISKQCSTDGPTTSNARKRHAEWH